MTSLERIRRCRSPMLRLVLTLFLCSSMGLAVQPCLAMQHASDGAQTGHHEPPDAADHHCPHCPPTPAPELGCHTAAAACDHGDAPVLLRHDAKPAHPDQVLLPTAIVFHGPTIDSAGLALQSIAADPRRPPTISLQQRFCSFLK